MWACVRSGTSPKVRAPGRSRSRLLPHRTLVVISVPSLGRLVAKKKNALTARDPLVSLVRAGETVARMPTSRCLTRSACAHADAVRRIMDDIGDDDQWLAALGAALLLERLGSLESSEETDTRRNEKQDERYARLSGYVASLPVREPNVVASWPETRRRFLAGTDVERALRCERAAAKREWEGCVASRSKEAALRDGFGSRASSFLTFERYLDARSVASSRAFSVTDELGPGLVPIADLFNHRTGGNHVAMRLARGGGREDDRRLLDGGDATPTETLGAVVVRRAKRGEEVFNAYGTLGNATLLNSYGFTQEKNPADTVSVSVPDVRAAAALRAGRGRVVAKRLESCFASNRAPFQEHALFPLRRGIEPPTALLVALWAATATDEAFARAERDVAGAGTDAGGTRRSAARDDAAAALWRVAAERAEVSGAIVTTVTAEVFLEILDRRRRMYVDVPADVGEDEPSDAETETWRTSLRVLVESELAIIDEHAAETKRRLAALRGVVVAEDEDEAKRREKRLVVALPAADPFALFD